VGFDVAGLLKSNGSAEGSDDTSFAGFDAATGVAGGAGVGTGTGIVTAGIERVDSSSTGSAIITSVMSSVIAGVGMLMALRAAVPPPESATAPGTAGTRNVARHFLHLAFLPIMVSGALSFALHAGQDTSTTGIAASRNVR
jgi:hypothetical protein